VLADARPEVVVHLAAVVGGIGANMATPGAFFYENALMGIQLIEEAAKPALSASYASALCAPTPSTHPRRSRKSDLWNGYPEETNAPYGLAKKMLLVQLQAYRSNRFRGRLPASR